MLIGGSPCQDLSIAKKDRKGLGGERSGLFYEYVRILKEVKPKYFILENVNSMPKEAKETITKELFGIEPIMINAALVSAQNRKRLFWVGKLVGDTYEQVKIEQPNDKNIYLKDVLEGGGAKTGLYYIPHGYIKGKIRQVDKYPALCSQDPSSKHLLLLKGYLRKLFPLECERLQSLPDNYTEGVSNSQRYKCCGNGFNCAVIEHILKNIK